MEFRILGPFEARRDGRCLSLAPRQQGLLAALLLRANQVLSADQLIDQLWGASPPTAARNALHSHIRRLRRMLEPFGDDTQLLSYRPGYVLKVGSHRLDLHAFEELVARGREARMGGDLERTVACLGAALALWRGPALAGIAAEGLRRVDVPRLEEWRLTVLEERIHAELVLGHHGELIGDLTALTAEYPFRERLHQQLMLALYRTGRQAEALTDYRKLREVLVEQLGIEPSPNLQQLQRAILVNDPALTSPAREPPAASPPAQRPPTRALEPGGRSLPVVLAPPRQLPPDIVPFTGRSIELQALSALLHQPENKNVVPIAAIHGAPGVGKSALAIHFAHQVRARFPHGQLYVDLHGANPDLNALEPDEVLGRFLRALGISGMDVPAQVEEQAALLRSLLTAKRVLVVLDNAHSASQVSPLLPASPGTAVLVTSRQCLVDLDGAAHLQLEVLAPGESVALLARLSGASRVDAEPQAAAAIVKLCGYLPLAVRIAGVRLAARPSWPLSVLAARLVDEHHRLDELEAASLAARASFEPTYRHLDANPRPGRFSDAHAFRLLALLEGRDFGVPVVTALLDQPHDVAAAALERLVDAHLLENPVPGCYRFHDLLRLFARERCAAEEPEGDRTEAVARVLNFHAPTSYRANS
jgi:DNA-binding SARP family transcriptional activator